MDQNSREELIATYNRGAVDFAEHFKGIGPRTDDILQAFSFFKRTHWKSLEVVEIGCGDGRDAEKIFEITPHYLGLDISEAMIGLAKKKMPQAVFRAANFLTYKFTKKIDIVFAFASLLHCDKEEIRNLLSYLHGVLNNSGIVYLSLKEGHYHCESRDNKHGRRIFCFYEPKDIKVLARSYKVVKISHKTISDIRWFDIILQKNPDKPRFPLTQQV